MDLESLPNKEFAYECIQLLKENGKLDEKNMSILTNVDTCKNMFMFSGNFQILQEVPVGICDEELKSYRCDRTGRNRYYKDLIMLENRCYIISNHWYGPNKSMPDNRSPFLKWVNEQIML